MIQFGGHHLGLNVTLVLLTTVLFTEFIKRQSAATLADVFIQSDHSLAIARGMIDGQIDIGCIMENTAIEAGIEELVINECDDPLVWVPTRTQRDGVEHETADGTKQWVAVDCQASPLLVVV